MTNRQRVEATTGPGTFGAGCHSTIKGGNCTVGVSAGGGVTIDDFVLADE